MGENLADFISTDIAYKAYRKMAEQNGADPTLPNLDFTPEQLFWIRLASDMCFNREITSDPDMIVEDNEHPDSKFRINGALKNSEFFGSDFQCPIGSAMNPSEKCPLI